MRQHEFSWKNPSGETIYAQSWLPDPQRNKMPRAILLLIHGLGEHSGRYAHVAEYFTHKNVGMIGCDRVGHGKSTGKRGHVKKYQYLFDDIERLHAEATRRYPKVPVFLYGHSMGGGLVLDYLLRHPRMSIKGVIATSPLLKTSFEPPKVLTQLARLIRPIYGSFSQNHGLDKDALSSDPAVVEAYINDPLVHTKITAEAAIGSLDSGLQSLRTVSKLSHPLLLMHGDKDGITSHKASEQFAASASGPITLKIWEGGYHELHNEPNKMEVLDFMMDWLIRHSRS